MDPSKCWDDMLIAYATKQWAEAAEHAEALNNWLVGGGFAPRPTIGTTTMAFTAQLDDAFSRAICVAACRHIADRAEQELVDTTC